MSLLLKQTLDGGDLVFENGSFVSDGGLSTMAYISMFGGVNFWANSLMTEFEKINSKTEKSIIYGDPITRSKLVEIDRAVSSDLSSFSSLKIASAVSHQITQSAKDRIKIDVKIEAESKKIDATYLLNWGAENVNY